MWSLTAAPEIRSYLLKNRQSIEEELEGLDNLLNPNCGKLTGKTFLWFLDHLLSEKKQQHFEFKSQILGLIFIGNELAGFCKLRNLPDTAYAVHCPSLDTLVLKLQFESQAQELFARTITLI